MLISIGICFTDVTDCCMFTDLYHILVLIETLFKVITTVSIYIYFVVYFGEILLSVHTLTPCALHILGTDYLNSEVCWMTDVLFIAYRVSGGRIILWIRHDKRLEGTFACSVLYIEAIWTDKLPPAHIIWWPTTSSLLCMLLLLWGF